MSLKGTLATMTLPDLLQWLSGSVKTGPLKLTNGRFSKEILFQGGVIVSTSSNDPREFLGQFLLAQRRISEEQLRKAMESQRSTGVLLGKILVMVGAIEEEELLKILRLKAEESIFNLFLWKKGSFEFTDAPIPEDLHFPLSLRVDDVLLEGLRRYDELQAILSAFSPGDSILERSDEPVPDKLSSDQEVLRLLDVVDGKRTLTDLCMELHASEFRISRIAYELYRHKCLRLVQIDGNGHREGSESLSSDELIERAHALVEGKKFEEALKLLGAAAKRRPSDPGLRQTLDRTEEQFTERAYRHYLPADNVLILSCDLDKLTDENLTPQEVFLATRINGSWTVKDIVTISPMREVETLMALKSLRERALVSLGQG